MVGMLVAAVVLVVDEMEGRAVAHALAHQHAQGQVARRSEEEGKRKEKELPAGRRMVALEWVGWLDKERRTLLLGAGVFLSVVFVQHNLMRVV